MSLSLSSKAIERKREVSACTDRYTKHKHKVGFWNSYALLGKKPLKNYSLLYIQFWLGDIGGDVIWKVGIEGSLFPLAPHLLFTWNGAVAPQCVSINASARANVTLHSSSARPGLQPLHQLALLRIWLLPLQNLTQFLQAEENLFFRPLMHIYPTKFILPF